MRRRCLYTDPMDIQFMDPANNGELGSLQEALCTTDDFWSLGINLSQRPRWGLTLVAGATT